MKGTAYIANNVDDAKILTPKGSESKNKKILQNKGRCSTFFLWNIKFLMIHIVLIEVEMYIPPSVNKKDAFSFPSRSK